MRAALLSLCIAGLTGCQPLALSVLGTGAGEALRYTYSGVTYRTFTAPPEAVKEATIAALERMGLPLHSFDRYERGELMYARSQHRIIEIELEPISPLATRVRIAAKNGSLLYDSATASEIIAQTERSLESAAVGGTARR